MPKKGEGRKHPYAMPSSARAFVKMHGLRNHFVIVDAREDGYRPSREDIVRICDPQAGVGADQFVLVEPPGEATRAAAFVRFWNADGREVEACGNASRCVAWLLFEEQAIERVLLESRAGLLDCRRLGPRRVSTDMGRIRTGWREIPLAEACDTLHVDVANGPLRDGVALNIGNPHVVYFVEDLDAVDVPALAPAIQRNPLFPQQANVGVAQMLGSRRMRLRVFERGAGLTQACGSGACVAHFAALSRGLTDARCLTVELPGGELEIEIRDDGSAVMSGPVAFSFGGWLPPPAE